MIVGNVLSTSIKEIDFAKENIKGEKVAFWKVDGKNLSFYDNQGAYRGFNLDFFNFFYDKKDPNLVTVIAKSEESKKETENEIKSREKLFDESKIINALHTDKAEIGKRYYFGDNFNDLIYQFTSGFLPEILVSITEDYFPFETKDGSSYLLLYPYEGVKEKIVPFTWEDRASLLGKIVQLKKQDTQLALITSVNRNSIVVGNAHLSYQDLLDFYIFADKSPCGKEVEE